MYLTARHAFVRTVEKNPPLAWPELAWDSRCRSLLRSRKKGTAETSRRDHTQTRRHFIHAVVRVQREGLNQAVPRAMTTNLTRIFPPLLIIADELMRVIHLFEVSEAHQEVRGAENPKGRVADFHLRCENSRSQDKSKCFNVDFNLSCFGVTLCNASPKTLFASVEVEGNPPPRKQFFIRRLCLHWRGHIELVGLEFPSDAALTVPLDSRRICERLPIVGPLLALIERCVALFANL